jgi:hypothetical protein
MIKLFSLNLKNKSQVNDKNKNHIVINKINTIKNEYNKNHIK